VTAPPATRHNILGRKTPSTKIFCETKIVWILQNGHQIFWEFEKNISGIFPEGSTSEILPLGAKQTHGRRMWQITSFVDYCIYIVTV